MSARPSASELLQTPGALLQRKHFRELGLERRAIDAIYRHCRVVYMPDYSHGMVRVELSCAAALRPGAPGRCRCSGHRPDSTMA